MRVNSNFSKSLGLQWSGVDAIKELQIQKEGFGVSVEGSRIISLWSLLSQCRGRPMERRCRV